MEVLTIGEWTLISGGKESNVWRLRPQADSGIGYLEFSRECVPLLNLGYAYPWWLLMQHRAVFFTKFLGSLFRRRCTGVGRREPLKNGKNVWRGTDITASIC